MSSYGSCATGPMALPPGGFTNIMDDKNMPSTQAEAARRKADAVMAALKKGEPGDADAAMGKQPADKHSNHGLLSLRRFGRKLSGKDGKEVPQEKGDKVVR